MKSLSLFILIFLTAISCTTEKKQSIAADFETVQDSTSILFSVEGLSEPEAVRYDPDQNVYFISNFNGGGNDLDSNGFITKVDAEGSVVEMEFMTGTDEFPFHAPRGMFIENGSLWVADVAGVHVFDTKTGTQQKFIDFSSLEPGFLNDVSSDGSGTVYVTDTGKPVVYKIENDTPTVFLDSLAIYPNGVTYDSENEVFVLAPWRQDSTFFSFNSVGEVNTHYTFQGGNFDGLEFDEGMLLVASQVDQSIRLHDGSSNRVLIHTPGRPADIGIERTNKILAVPYIALDRVDFWSYSKD
jgi:sugar lactone lactonase YvrE